MNVPSMPAARIVRGATTATLTHQFTDGDGEPVAPAGTPTVSVTRSDGSAVSSGAVSQSGTGPAESSVAAAELAVTDWLTAVWSDDGTAVASTVVEVVGGVLSSATALRTADPSIAQRETFEIVAARNAVDDVLLGELHRAPLERFYTERVDGSGSCDLIVAFPDVVEVVWARTWNNTTSTDLTAAEIAAIPASPNGVLTRTDGAVWPSGHRNVEVGYRFGMSAVPNDIAQNVPLMVRHQLALTTSTAPYQSESIRTADGVLVSLARPGVGRSITGNDEVDASIRRHRFDVIGVA